MTRQQHNVWHEFLNFWHRHGLLNKLILANVIVFALTMVLNVLFTLSSWEQVYDSFLSYFMLPSQVRTFLLRPWSLLTYAFLHVGFWHILFNMLFLYWFGRVFCDFLGERKLLNVFLLGCMAAGVFFIVIYNVFPYYSQAVASSRLLGASGGVYAVVVATATLVPNHAFYLLLFGPIQIKYIAIFSVFISFTGIVGGNAGGELAHLGGALLGFFYIRYLRQGKDLGRYVDNVRAYISKTLSSRPPSKKDSRSTSVSGVEDAQAEIDAILDKISAKGYDSLTRKEKERLFKASSSSSKNNKNKAKP